MAGSDVGVRRPLGATDLVSYWGPLVGWLAMIFVFSGDALSARHTSGFIEPFIRWILPWASQPTVYGVHVAIRKLGHVLEYAVLGLLAFRAIRCGRPERFRASWAAGAVCIGAAYAGVDELHQSFVASRTGTVSDAVIDVAGCFAAVVLLAWWRTRGAVGPRRERTDLPSKS